MKSVLDCNSIDRGIGIRIPNLDSFDYFYSCFRFKFIPIYHAIWIRTKFIRVLIEAKKNNVLISSASWFEFDNRRDRSVISRVFEFCKRRIYANSIENASLRTY